MLLVIRGLEGLLHELLDIAVVNPSRAEPHFNFRRIQILRLCLPERFYIGQIAGAVYCGFFCFLQLSTDIAGKVFVCRLPVAASRVEENDTVQLVNQFILTFAGELCHIVHIHTGFFRDGQRQRFRCCVHRGHDLMRLDRALRKNIRFSLQLAVLIQNFQRTEQIIGAVVRERETVGAGIDKTVFAGKRIIKPV